jgi:hypothetical protein
VSPILSKESVDLAHSLELARDSVDRQLKPTLLRFVAFSGYISPFLSFAFAFSNICYPMPKLDLHCI